MSPCRRHAVCASRSRSIRPSRLVSALSSLLSHVIAAPSSRCSLDETPSGTCGQESVVAPSPGLLSVRPLTLRGGGSQRLDSWLLMTRVP